ncbi:TPA: hypothetical protein N0F65_004043, partial [Lagenidium giganteum]
MLAKAAFLAAFLALAQAKDYPGGWIPGTPKEQCVDICVGSSPVPGCPKDANGNADPNCLAKKVVPGDFDYLMLEQLYVPQFCRDLLTGTDSTVSHQHVLPFPDGVRCKDSVVKNEMTIHGLWPNYEQGYPGCCNVSATIPNRPFNAAKFAKDQAPLLKEMSEKWIEPTVDSSYDSLCEIYNHEFQKHGLCYKTFEEDYDKAAAFYFRSTLNVAKLVDAATAKLNEFAASKAASTTLKDVEALYSKKVQVLCSAVDGQNQLSAVRTCWNKPTDISLETVFEQRDCSPATKMGAFVPCPADAPLTLLAYKSPTTGAPTPAPTNATVVPMPSPSTAQPTSAAPTKAPTQKPTAKPCKTTSSSPQLVLNMFSKAAFLAAFVALAHAKDYPGSWIPGSPKEQCVDICVGSSPVPGCFKDAIGNADPNCLAKKVVPGDFDYLMLEQLYVPQFCRDLLQGTDSTVSHQNVLPFPDGVRCKDSVVKNEMTIHGLWPNYEQGYPGCC